jgi:hypothetical protein
VLVWVYHNPLTGEAAVYDTGPPELFGRRQDDIGPVELDEDLSARYGAAKDAWHAAQGEFMTAMKAAELVTQPTI